VVARVLVNGVPVARTVLDTPCRASEPAIVTAHAKMVGLAQVPAIAIRVTLVVPANFHALALKHLA